MGDIDLTALADRVEALAGPCRETDALIADAVFGPVKPPYRRGFCEKYTASIDAAMAIVPEGWPSCCFGRLDDGSGYAQLAGNDMFMASEDPDEFYLSAEAATPAIAITAAALRARAASRLSPTNGKEG